MRIDPGSEVVILTHERSVGIQNLPVLPTLLAPCRCVFAFGRSARADPPCDVAHAVGHWWFDVLLPAMQDARLPDDLLLVLCEEDCRQHWLSDIASTWSMEASHGGETCKTRLELEQEGSLLRDILRASNAHHRLEGCGAPLWVSWWNRSGAGAVKKTKPMATFPQGCSNCLTFTPPAARELWQYLLAPPEEHSPKPSKSGQASHWFQEGHAWRRVVPNHFDIFLRNVFWFCCNRDDLMEKYPRLGRARFMLPMPCCFAAHMSDTQTDGALRRTVWWQETMYIADLTQWARENARREVRTSQEQPTVTLWSFEGWPHPDSPETDPWQRTATPEQRQVWKEHRCVLDPPVHVRRLDNFHKLPIEWLSHATDSLVRQYPDLVWQLRWKPAWEAEKSSWAMEARETDPGWELPSEERHSRFTSLSSCFLGRSDAVFHDREDRQSRWLKQIASRRIFTQAPAALVVVPAWVGAEFGDREGRSLKPAHFVNSDNEGSQRL